MSLQALLDKFKSEHSKNIFESVTTTDADIWMLINACEIMRNDLEIIAVGGQHERTSVAWARAAVAKADKVCGAKSE